MFIEIIWIPIIHVESSHWFNWHLISNVKKVEQILLRNYYHYHCHCFLILYWTTTARFYFVVKGASDSCPTRYYATHPKSLDKLLSYLSLFCHFRSRHFLDQWTIIQFGKVCERQRVQTTLTSEGEVLFKCLPYIMNESYIVTVSTKEGVVGLKYSKFCQRGLYTPSLLKYFRDLAEFALKCF